MKSTIAVILACLVFSLPVAAYTTNGKVVHVVDGDTIDVLNADKVTIRIRMAGIDAPEKAQAFGRQSTEHLSTLVAGKHVSVEWYKLDRDKRQVGKVLVTGKDANFAQVQAGFAWHSKEYQNEQSPADRAAYAKAETDARARKMGLWIDPNPIPPSDFRHGTGDASPEKRMQAGEACPCGGTVSCTGPKGGSYCMTKGNKKKYL
jgi:endonuclease YncB( thermonuclease family)